MTNSESPTSAVEHPASRASILVEDAKVLAHTAWPGEQYILKLAAPGCAARAEAGQFVHLQISANQRLNAAMPQLRRPISIMRVNPQEGWIELLYKVVGQGTAQLADLQVGDQVDLIGPIGVPFSPDPARKLPLLIGGGVGMPPMIYLAEHIKSALPGHFPLVILGSEVPFPFNPVEAGDPVAGLPAQTCAAMPELEALGIDSRLASQNPPSGDFSCCFQGYVTELAAKWLDTLDDEQRQMVEIFSCGPHPMLEAVARLARDYDLPAQLSLEEFMACAVGGCAGCTVEVMTDTGPAMKRVCVDGPVFDACAVFPGHFIA